MTKEEKDQAVRDHGGLAVSLGHHYFTSFPLFMDREDWISEAYVGMTLALNDFKEGLGRSLPSYIRLCIDRQLQKVVKHHRRSKRQNGMVTHENLPDLSLLYCGSTGEDTDWTPQSEFTDSCHHTQDMLDKMEMEYIQSVLTTEEMGLLLWAMDGSSIASYSRLHNINRRTGSQRFIKIKNKIHNELDRGRDHC